MAKINNLKIVKPPPVKPGDRVGVISPSSRPSSQLDLSKAVYLLEEMGFKAVVGKHAMATSGYLAGTDSQRAEDLNHFFADESIRAIFCSTGGYGALRLLSLIDFDTIAKHPKLFCGSDDNVTINLALWTKLHLVTLHSPNLDSIQSKYTYDCLKTAVTSSLPIGKIRVCDNHINTSADATHFNWPGANFVGAPVIGNVNGTIVGGNLTALGSLMGTPYMPDLSSAVLFLEDLDERSDVLDRWFINLDIAGHLQAAAGIALGQFINCGTFGAENMLNVDELFADRLVDLKKTCCFGFPIGQGLTTATVPIGIAGTLCASAGELQFLEPVCA